MLSSLFFLAAAEDGADAGKAIALALGIGLGSLGAGVGIGNIFGSMVQALPRQPAAARAAAAGPPVARLRPPRGGRLLRPHRRSAGLRPRVSMIDLLAAESSNDLI